MLLEFTGLIKAELNDYINFIAASNGGCIINLSTLAKPVAGMSQGIIEESVSEMTGCNLS